jgi:hypothetical protein
MIPDDACGWNVNAAVIGTAERSLRQEPDSWRDWESHEVALEQLK